MSQNPDVSSIFSTFFHILNELEPFVEVHDLKLAFDRERNAYLTGKDFQVQLQCNLTLPREVKTELRQIIAQHCRRIPPAEVHQI